MKPFVPSVGRSGVQGGYVTYCELAPAAPTASLTAAEGEFLAPAAPALPVAPLAGWLAMAGAGCVVTLDGDWLCSASCAVCWALPASRCSPPPRRWLAGGTSDGRGRGVCRSADGRRLGEG